MIAAKNAGTSSKAQRLSAEAEFPFRNAGRRRQVRRLFWGPDDLPRQARHQAARSSPGQNRAAVGRVIHRETRRGNRREDKIHCSHKTVNKTIEAAAVQVNVEFHANDQ